MIRIHHILSQTKRSSNVEDDKYGEWIQVQGGEVTMTSAELG